MPLNDLQQQTINHSISYLFTDLPREEKKLRLEVIKITSALLGCNEDKKNDYADLQQFMQLKYFYNLKKLNIAPLTNGEIQIQICNFIDEQLKEATEKSQIDFTKLQWNKNKIVALLANSPSFNHEFKSTPSPTMNYEEHPYELEFPGRLMRAFLVPDRQLRTVQLHLNIATLPQEVKKEIWLDPFPTLPFILEMNEERRAAAEAKVEETFNAFMRRQRDEKAPPLIEQEAKTAIIPNLFPNKQVANISIHAIKLLTYEYYYLLVKKNPTQLRKFKNITEDQAITLSHPNIILLLQQGRCSIKTAKKFTSSTRILLTNFFYFNLFINGKIKLNDIKNITHQQCQILNLPLIRRILEENNYQFAQVKNVSLYAKDILVHPVYVKFLTSHPCYFHTIKNINAEQRAQLLNPSLCKLIEENDINPNVVKDLTHFAERYDRNQPSNMLSPHARLFFFSRKKSLNMPIEIAKMDKSNKCN